jgi:hypothetical protein
MEVIVVLLVLSILAALSILAFTRSKTDLQRQAIAGEFKLYLERARFDSVKRRAAADADMARVTLTSATSFTAALDFNQDGVLSAGELQTVNFQDRSQTQILVSDPLNYPLEIRFDQRGHVTAKDSFNNAIQPLFSICSNCSATTPDKTMISISTTGTVAIIRDGQSPTALPTPVITNTAATLNCYVLDINTNTTCRLQ